MSGTALWTHPAECEDLQCTLGAVAPSLGDDGLPDFRKLVSCGCLLGHPLGMQVCAPCRTAFDAVAIPSDHEHAWAPVYGHLGSPVLCYSCLTTGPASPAEESDAASRGHRG